MNFQKGAIYTSGPLPMNRQTSHQFAAYGAVGAPASIGELRITMVKTKPNSTLVILLSQLWALIASLIKSAKISLVESLTLPATSVNYDLSPRPSLVITINPKSSDAKIKSLETAGFAPRSNGRYKYYVGPATDQAARAAIQEGVATDAMAPGNSVSVNGLVLYSVMSRILFHAFVVLYTLPDLKEFSGKLFDDTPAMPTVADSFKLNETRLTELPDKGFYFPYFDGLLLPDHGTTLTTFVKLFSPLFGTTPNSIAQSARTFGSGWSSLSNTIAGKEYSHMLYCIDLAISCGIPVRPVFLAGQYAGCVFDTSDCITLVGGSVYVPEPREGILDGIKKMQSHESSLAEICAILSNLEQDAGDIIVLSPATITSARHLHNVFRRYAFGPTVQQQLVPLIRRLRFEQKLWDVTNPQHVRQVVHFITTKTFPPESIPMNMRIDAMFTKLPIYSALGAFGIKAPSLRGSGTQIVKRIAPKFYESLDKPGRLVGIPVFAKSHQEAKEDWEGILNEFTVFFDHKGKDKEGRIRVRNLTASIPFDTDDAKAITNSLVALVAKKRKREDEEEGKEKEMTQKEIDEAAKKKRRREKGYGMMGFALGLAQGEGGAMEVDEEDIFA